MKRIAFASIVLVVLTIACAPTSIPVPPTAPATAIFSATATPTLTPAPTRTPTITPTSTPAITAATWASDANGKVNPQAMYPLVGAINYKHRKTIDLTVGQLRLAVVTDQDLTKLNESAQKDLRTKLVASLEQNPEFKKQLAILRARLAESHPSQASFKIVVDSAKPIQAILQQDDALLRYKVEFDTQGLVSLAEWKNFALLPQLRIEGSYILRTDQVAEEERRIQFKGGSLHVFFNGKKTFAEAKGYIDLAKQWGMNVIRLNLGDPDNRINYSELQKSIDYAEENGMYCIIIPGNNYPTDEIKSRVLDLAKLFSGKRNVIYQTLNEPVSRPNLRLSTDQWFTWQKNTAGEVRNIDPTSIIMASGLKWGGSYFGMRAEDYLPNAIYDVHYYYGEENGRETTVPLTEWDFLIGRVPVISTEMGNPYYAGGRDNSRDADFIRRYINLAKQHPQQMHWVAFELAPSDWKTSILSSSDGKPSSRGLPYLDDLSDIASSPPTIFTR